MNIKALLLSLLILSVGGCFFSPPPASANCGCVFVKEGELYNFLKSDGYSLENWEELGYVIIVKNSGKGVIDQLRREISKFDCSVTQETVEINGKVYEKFRFTTSDGVVLEALAITPQ